MDEHADEGLPEGSGDSREAQLILTLERVALELNDGLADRTAGAGGTEKGT